MEHINGIVHAVGMLTILIFAIASLMVAGVVAWFGVSKLGIALKLWKRERKLERDGRLLASNDGEYGEVHPAVRCGRADASRRFEGIAQSDDNDGTQNGEPK